MTATMTAVGPATWTARVHHRGCTFDVTIEPAPGGRWATIADVDLTYPAGPIVVGIDYSGRLTGPLSRPVPGRYLAALALALEAGDHAGIH